MAAIFWHLWYVVFEDIQRRNIWKGGAGKNWKKGLLKVLKKVELPKQVLKADLYTQKSTKKGIFLRKILKKVKLPKKVLKADLYTQKSTQKSKFPQKSAQKRTQKRIFPQKSTQKRIITQKSGSKKLL